MKDKVVIVTGASSGIGASVARAMHDRGATVVLAARSESVIKRMEKELPGSLAIPTDMTIERQVERLIKKTEERFGRIDILVNNAGQGYDASVVDIDMDRYKAIMELDFFSVIRTMQLVAPIMERGGGGSIMNVSSGLALMHLPNMGGYAAAKAALAHISLTAREELKDKGIRVGVIYPYITETEFERNTLHEQDHIETGTVAADYEMPAGDSADYVAGILIEGIISGAAQVYAHDWMATGGARP